MTPRTSSALRRTAPRAIAVTAAAAAATVLLAGPASAATGRVMTSGYNLNVRSGPGTGYAVVGSLAPNATVSFSCYLQGTAVAGPYGTETIWDRLDSGGYVADAWIYTGTNAATVPVCGAVTPPPSSGRAHGRTTGSNNGVAGQCTWGAYEQWHAATGYYPLISGNAKDWANSARANGWTVVADAQPRSIVVFQPGVQGASRPYGHVGWVTSTAQRSDGLYVTFTEMNGTAGPGRYDQRTVKDVAGMSYILAP